MATPINRTALREHLWPGILMWFDHTQNEVAPQYPELYTEKNSEKAYEEFVMNYNLGLGAEKPEGEGVTFDAGGHAWKHRVDMHAYALGYIITREAVEDNLYEDSAERFTRALGKSMRHTKEVRAADYYNGAFTTSVGGDGKPMCAHDHPLANGGTFANKPASAADFAEQTVENALITIQGWTDERGLLMAIRGRKVVVPTSLMFTAERVFKTQGRPGTSDNDVHALRSRGALPEGYAVNDFLTDPKAWFILTDIDEGPMHFQRSPLDILNKDGGDTLSIKVLAYERYAFTHGDPRGIYGMPGS